MLKRHIHESDPLKIIVAKVLSAMLNFSALSVKYIKQKRHSKFLDWTLIPVYGIWVTNLWTEKFMKNLFSGPDQELLKAKQQFRDARDMEERILSRLQTDMIQRGLDNQNIVEERWKRKSCAEMQILS